MAEQAELAEALGWSERGGQVDANAQKMSAVEKVEIEALGEINPTAPGSASVAQFIKYGGTLLPFRRMSRIAVRRAEAERPENYNPDIRVT